METNKNFEPSENEPHLAKQKYWIWRHTKLLNLNTHKEEEMIVWGGEGPQILLISKEMERWGDTYLMEVLIGILHREEVIHITLLQYFYQNFFFKTTVSIEVCLYSGNFEACQAWEMRIQKLEFFQAKWNKIEIDCTCISMILCSW